MAQGTPQFSPAQVLEAGRRAEAEGKYDYAVQFYRHLVTHFASSAEAGAARDGLDRIERGSGTGTGTQSVSSGSTMGRSGPRTGSPVGSGAGHLGDGATTRSGPYLNGADHNHHSTSASSWSGHSTPTSLGASPSASVSGRSADPFHDAPMRSGMSGGAIVLPPAEDGYRLGRALSHLVSAVGWAMFIGGIALLVASEVVDPSHLGPAAVLTAFGPTPLGAAACVGFWLVFSAQRARAAFDIANSTQALVAIERAKHGR